MAFTDDFTNTNGTALSTHSANYADLDTRAITNLEIQNNTLQCTNDFGSPGCRRTDSTVDYVAAVFKAQTTVSSERYLCLRSSATSRGYEAVPSGIVGNNATAIWALYDGAYIGDITTSISWDLTTDINWYFRVVDNGTGLDMYAGLVGGTEYGPLNEATRSADSGNPGFWCNVTSVAADFAIDDFTDIASSGVNTILDNFPRGHLRGVMRGVK